MKYQIILSIDYDFDNPKLREIQEQIKELAPKYGGILVNTCDEWNESRATFALVSAFVFTSKDLLVDFLIEQSEEYPDAAVINVSKNKI